MGNTDMTTVDQLLRDLIDRRHTYVEALAAAFLRATNIPPQDAVLVERRTTEGTTYTIEFAFERKSDRNWPPVER